MEIKKVKTAIVGCGMISHVYIRNLLHLFSIIDLVAVCDLRQEAAEEKVRLYGVPKTMTIDEIANSDEIELVVNLTAPVAHYSVIKQMLEHGKHVYTEKMMTTTLEEGKELVELANAKHLYLGVSPDTVLGAGIQTARWAIEAGLIGKVTSVVACINRNQCLNSETYRFLRNNGGALPYDVGIYYVGAMLAMLGPVQAVTCFAAPAPVHEAQLLYQGEGGKSWQIPGNNLVVGALKFESGVLGSVHFNGNTTGAFEHALTVYGTDGVLEVGDPNTFGAPVKLIRANGGECILPMTHGYNGDAVLPDATGYEKGYGHRGVGVAEMAWAIRQNRPNRCSKEMGLHAQEVLCGLDLSADSGERYVMQSAFERPAALKAGYKSSMFGGKARGDAERSLID